MWKLFTWLGRPRRMFIWTNEQHRSSTSMWFAQVGSSVLIELGQIIEQARQDCGVCSVTDEFWGAKHFSKSPSHLLSKRFKGAMSRYSVIFCAFFARAKNGGCSRKCCGHQIWSWKLGRPRGLAAWPAYAYAGCWHDVSAVNQRQVEPELHCFTLSRSTATGSTFVFRLQGPSKVISTSSRFKISSDSYIDIDSLFGCLVMRAFRSLHPGDLVAESMGDWEKESAVWS